MTENQNPLENSDNDVQIIPPDYAIKKILGDNVDIKSILSGENIAEAQEVINDHKNDFREWVVKDIESLNDCYNRAISNIADPSADMEEMAKLASTIKAHGGTFGYNLATLVAKSLDKFCNKVPNPTVEQMTVIRKHIDTLSVIFAKNIEGDGGEIGKELLGGLLTLVEKYS